MDRRRFVQLWQRCMPTQGGDCAPLFDEIATRYAEPHRHYHTPDHVEHCLVEFDVACEHMDDPDAVELAIWYHDIVYDVGTNDNEQRSAELFKARAAGMSEQRVSAVYDLIMVTVHAELVPATRDQGFMVDIDLSSFGMPWERFLEDSVAVREEYQHLSDEEFYPKQRDFLAALMSRDHFCFTPFFRARHELRARQNIVRYLEGLEAKGLI
jgi:predicted metal-dependent HD superfamily phosphohydrolase